MKNSLYALLIIIVFHQNLFSQSFWAYTAGSIKEDETMDICYDQNGNIISTGYIAGQTTFNVSPTSIILNSTSNGNPDIYVSKSNASGQIIWAVKAGGSGSDRALSVKTDSNGNIYITGFYYGTATFGTITLTSISGSQDGFLAKLDGNGNFLWAKSFGGNLAEWGNAVAVDELDNPIITGQFQGTTNFSGTTLTSLINPNTSFSSFDVFVAKYSPTGNVTWVNKGSAKYDDRGLDIITDSQNNIYVCGQFSDTIQFQNTHHNQIMNASFIIKYNSTGNEQWFRKASGVFSIPYSMVMDNANKIYIAGDFQGSFTFFGSSGNSFINGTYTNKAFLMKIDDTGNFIWGKSESSTNYISNKRVALDAQQDPYIFGEFGCTMNEYSDAYGPGVFNSIGFGDLFITKYNNSGTRQWFRHYGGPRNDKAHGLLVAGINEPIMAGSYEHHMNIPSTNNSLISINNSFGWNNTNTQPTNYCSAPNNYSDYNLLYCHGYSDMFIYKGVDLTRNPYDYYNRSGTSCNLNYVGSCIEDRFGLLQCPDTIPICYKNYIKINERANASGYYNNSYIGPIFKYQWNNSLTDTLQELWVSSSGYNYAKVSTIDGCYSSFDTVYVKINPLPAPPTITDSYGINNQHLPWANNIHVCGPATITLTGGNIQGNSYQWHGNTISTQDSSALVNSNGLYYFVVTNIYGCTDTNAVHVQIDPSIPTFAPKQKNDTVTICQNGHDLHIICDTITNPSLIFPYPCVSNQNYFVVSQSPGLTLNQFNSSLHCDLSFWVGASATGNYTYTVGYVINNSCTHDTIFFTGHVYIIVKPLPTGTITVSGNANLCPGDSSLVSVTNVSIFPSTTNYTVSPFISNWVHGAGTIYFYLQMKDSITGCSNYANYPITITVKPNPFIILNPYNSIICPNDSVKLTLNLPGALSYEWHGPSGLLPVTSQSFYSNQAGFYHCIVTDTTGCVFTTNTVELKQYATPYLISTPTNIICNNQPITLNVVTLDATQIVWNAPLSGSGATKVITNPGVYSCQVTMCGITTSLSINVLGSNPTANITTFGSTTVCPFDSVLLTGNPGMTNYIWQPGNHLGQNYTVHSPGSYTLEVTDIYGCTALSSPISVAFSSTVAPPISIVNDTICAGQTATLSALSLVGNQLDWFPNANSGSIIHTGTSFTTPTLTSQTTYYVASVNSSGCHSFGIPATVFMYQTSVPPILLTDTTVCKHDSLIITAPYINGATYNWSGPGIGTNNTNHISIGNADSTNAGLYILQVSGFGCSSPSSSVTIQVLSPLPPVVSSLDSICEHTNYSAVINPINTNYSYEWQGPNNYNNTSDSLNIINANINQSGTYTITSNLFGCLSSSQTLQLTVLEIPQAPNIISNSPCQGDTLFLNINSPNTNYTYDWYDSNGYVTSGDSIFILTSTTFTNTYYGVIAANIFCISPIAYDSIQVIPYPILTASNDTVACENSIITLSSSSNYFNYLWNTGSTNSSISVNQSGTYWVSSQNGNCLITDSIYVSIIPCNDLGINVFTPNGDGTNDIFMFKSLAIKSIHCEIRNRWGEKMSEFSGKENGWNGKNIFNNKECEDGTYFYIAEIETIEGINKNINGFITLIR